MNLTCRKTPLLIAHRGNSAFFPENTAPAFESIDNSAGGIETDIQLTKDGVPVLFHDRTMKKITGTARKIYTHSLSELKKLDFGGWFSPEFKGTQILSLEEFLQTHGHGKQLFLEIKARNDDPPHISKQLTEAIVSLVKKKSMEKSIVLLSFNPVVLKQAYTLCKTIRCFQVFEKHLPFQDTRLKTPWISGFVVSLPLLSKGFVETIHSEGKNLATFTCNTEEEVLFAKDLSVEAILSDNPIFASKFLI